jgi:hypothetical protein
VGPQARLGTGDPKRWAKRCSIRRACPPFEALRRCDAALAALDFLSNSPADREGHVVALRGTLSLAPLITTAAACRPQPRDLGQPCCNQIGSAAVVQCGSIAVELDRLGCTGDDSGLCCDTPAFGQHVIATGKLIHIPLGPGGIEWQLNDPRLCVEAR